MRFGDVVKNVNETERSPLKAGLERYVGLDCLDPENLRISRWGMIADGISFTKRFSKGQVLFGKRRAYQRKVAVAEWDGLCSGDILTFEPKNDKLLPELLPFIVQSDSFFDHALDTSVGSLSPRTKWSLLKEYQFLLPPKNQQKKIVDILWAAEYTSRAYRKVFEKLNILLTSKWQNHIKKIPDNRVKLGEIAEIKTGGTPSRRTKSYWGGDIPWMSSGEVHQEIINETAEHITEDGLNNSNARWLPKNTVIIALNGQGKTKGTVSLLGIPLTCNQSLAGIICDDNAILPEYLLYTLKNRYWELRGLAGGDNRSGLNLGLLRNLKICCPNLSEQLFILKHIKEIKKEMTLAMNSESRIKQIFKLMIKKTFD